MALSNNSSRPHSSEQMKQLLEKRNDSPVSPKASSGTRHQYFDTTATNETDSICGGSTIVSTEEGDRDGSDEYHRDPGQVNIHQFYPMLDHIFNHNQAAKKTQSDNDQLFAIIEEKQTADGSLDNINERQNIQPGDDKDNDEEEEVCQDQDPEGSDDVNGQRTITQGIDFGTTLMSKLSSTGPEQSGVFPTAVDEDSIAAAKERRQVFFSTEKWQGGRRHREFGLAQIVTERAYEHYQNALQMKEEQNLLGIVTCLNKAINLKSDDPVFYVERAEAYIKLCDFQSAILNYRKACLLEARNQVYYLRLAFVFYFHGQTLFDQKLYHEALESFSRASEMMPDNVGYQIRSIACLAALQRYGECLALVNKRLETNDNNPDLYIMRARLHQMFRNTTLCYYDVKDALILNPNHVESQVMMDAMIKCAKNNKMQAMHLNIAGKYREALQKISIAIEANPSVADYHVLRGALHRKLNDFNAAIDDFLLALDKCDHDEDSLVYANSQRQLLLTYNDFAVECFGKGFYEEAIILLNKAIKGEKQEKSLYINRGDCFFKEGEFTFALEDYHQALELDGFDRAIKARISVLHNEFGVNLYQEKNYAGAEAEFSLAVQHNPQVGQYYLSRSRTHYMMENVSGAREDLLLGLLLAPGNEDVLSILSRLFPGKSVSDVINSPAAHAAQIKLNNLVTKDFPVDLKPVGHSGSMKDTDNYSDGHEGTASLADETRGATAGPEATLDQTTQFSSGFAMCLEEKEFYDQQVQEKKKVEHKVKDALINRRTLRYNGSRVQPLPPSASIPRYRTYQGHRQILTTETNKKKSSTNWRTFSLGLGGLQNV